MSLLKELWAKLVCGTTNISSLWDFAKDPLASLTITTRSAFLKFVGQSHCVLMNLFEGAQGQRKRATAVVAGDDRTRAFCGGLQEGFDLSAQWLYCFHFQHASVYAGPGANV